MMMQHNATTMSSAAAKANKRGVVSSLQGPRPLPLSLPGTTTSPRPPRPAKRPRVGNGGGSDDDGVRAPPRAAAASGPVIVYEHTPKVIHARPDEFKALVQRLTGRQPAADCSDQDQDAVLRLPAQKTPPSSFQQEATTTSGDPLVLTLGQQQVPPPPPLDDHHHYTPPPVLPSPAGAGGGFLLSPGSLLFSPATMQAIHELIS